MLWLVIDSDIRRSDMKSAIADFSCRRFEFSPIYYVTPLLVTPAMLPWPYAAMIYDNINTR